MLHVGEPGENARKCTWRTHNLHTVRWQPSFVPATFLLWGFSQNLLVLSIVLGFICHYWTSLSFWTFNILDPSLHFGLSIPPLLPPTLTTERHWVTQAQLRTCAVVGSRYSSKKRHGCGTAWSQLSQIEHLIVSLSLDFSGAGLLSTWVIPDRTLS